MDELLYTQEDINEWIRTCEELQEKIKEQEETIEKLSEYKKLEEQGLLKRLRCKVGDTVYLVGTRYCPYCEEYEDHCSCDKSNKPFILPVKINSIQIGEKDMVFTTDDINCFSTDRISVYLSELGKKWLFTREEAEKKLEELKGEEK